jgi:hypothetical protein
MLHLLPGKSGPATIGLKPPLVTGLGVFPASISQGAMSSSQYAGIKAAS